MILYKPYDIKCVEMSEEDKKKLNESIEYINNVDVETLSEEGKRIILELRRLVNRSKGDEMEVSEKKTLSVLGDNIYKRIKNLLFLCSMFSDDVKGFIAPAFNVVSIIAAMVLTALFVIGFVAIMASIAFTHYYYIIPGIFIVIALNGFRIMFNEDF